MAVSKEKCIQCGTRYRPAGLENISPSNSLDSDGSFMKLPYWFCSVECYKKSVRKYLEDDRFDFDKKVQDDKEYLEVLENANVDYLAETSGGLIANLFNKVAWQSQLDYVSKPIDSFVESFNVQKESAIIGAEIELHNRLAAEWDHEREQEAAARDKETAKRDEQFTKLMAEEKERLALQEAYEEMLEPKPIPLQYRFDHTHILGGSGQGKSTLILKQFMEDLTTSKHPALVVIDPKGTMVDQLRRLECFQVNDNEFYQSGVWEWSHLVIIDPTLFSPALNMFAPAKRKYAVNIQQQLENNAISLFQYIFVTKGSALTDKQMTCFSFSIPLILSIPNATIHTLLDLMSDKPIPKTGGMRPDSPFKPFIDRLGPTAKRFFYESFYDPTEYGATKDQIATRIFGILRYPAFDAMFSTTQNKLDMFDCLQKGKVVLISSPKSILGAEGSKIFSRYMVALTLQAAFERKTITKDKWHPAFLVIDEAQDVIDEVKTPEMLEQAREFKLGVTIAHQNIKGQLNEALFSSMSANTRIKYAGTRSHQDASIMAKDMHCEPEFIMQQKIGSFACFVGGMTDHPFSVQLELGEIDDYTKMSDKEFDALLFVLNEEFGVDEKQNDPKPEVPPARLFPDTQTAPEGAVQLNEVRPRPPEGIPPEGAKPIPPQKESDPSKPAKWTRK